MTFRKTVTTRCRTKINRAANTAAWDFAASPDQWPNSRLTEDINMAVTGSMAMAAIR